MITSFVACFKFLLLRLEILRPDFTGMYFFNGIFSGAVQLNSAAVPDG